MNSLGSERAAVAAVIDPDAYAAGTVTSGWVDMGDFEQIMAVVMAGDLGSSATVDAKLEQATDSSGTGAKDVTGKSITQLTQAGSDDNKQAIINCRGSELDMDNDFNHVRLSLTVGTATSDAGGVVLGMSSRFEPASDYDSSTVDEIVA